MADALFLVLLVLHIGAIVAWMGGATLFVSVIIPSLSRMSPRSRAEFIQSTLPRYLRFITGTSILAIIAGLILYGYATTQTGASFFLTTPGLYYIQAGAAIGLVVVIIALGILVPAGRKFLALTKQAPTTDTQASNRDSMTIQITGLQKRMGMAGRLGVALLGIALVLMIIGGSI